MKNKRTFVLPVALLAVLLLLWELVLRFTQTPSYILPRPTQIGKAFCADLPVLLQHAGVTLTETLIGLLLACCLAGLLALCMDAWPSLRAALHPLLVVTQTVPVIVMAPIFIIYLGFGLAPKVLTVVLMCFFPIAISFADALGAQDPRRVNLLRSMGANAWQVYRLVKIPGALPAYFSGLKVASTYSITGAVVGEWLAASSGLGYYMLRVKNGYQLDRVFASVLMVSLLSLLMSLAASLLAYCFVKPRKKLWGR